MKIDVLLVQIDYLYLDLAQVRAKEADVDGKMFGHH